MDQDIKIAIKIPPSVDDGMLLRIREKGHQALNGNIGDLILNVGIIPDRDYTRKGFDIHSTINVSVT